MNDAAPTKQRILDAAERLFAERGVAATSLRAIIAEAGVNLAAVHYHFGSKEALLKAVVHRKIDPINRQRLALLEECERRGRPPLAKLVEAFFAPMIQAWADPNRGAAFVKLVARLMSEPDDFFGHVAPEQFREVRQRFQAAFQKALPKVPLEEIIWRMMFALGAVAHALRVGEYMPALTGGICGKPAPHELLEKLVQFITAGLKAPVSGAAK